MKIFIFGCGCTVRHDVFSAEKSSYFAELVGATSGEGFVVMFIHLLSAVA